MSTFFKAALQMPIHTLSDKDTAYRHMKESPRAFLYETKQRLRQAIDTAHGVKERGVCGTAGAHDLIPVLAASFPESLHPGVAAAYPIGHHAIDTPWSPRRKRLAAHCLGMIETFLAETAPSKAYKPAHGGYPCSA